MTKNSFLSALDRALSQLPPEEREKHLSYYSELIDDMVEDGMSEEEATAKLGDVREIADTILHETPLPLLVKTSVRRERSLSALAIVLLILGFPLWGSLLLAVIAVALAAYAVLWAVIVVLFAAVLAVGVGAAALLVVFILNLGIGLGKALMVLGAALAFAGVCLLLLALSVLAAKLVCKATAAMGRGIKSLFIRKERAA